MADIVRAFDDLDEINEVQEVVRHRRTRVRFREQINPLQVLSDNEFRRRYRLTKETVKYLINMIRDDLQPKQERRNVIGPKLQVLVTLRFFAKGLYQEDNADLHGLPQKAVSNIVRKVSVALARRAPSFIKIGADLDAAKRGFFRVAGFPSVVACVDCTHIKIKNPDKDRPLLYCNRKGWHSLNVQVACDSKHRIVDLVARWRGSAHDSRIWDGCTLKQRLESRELAGLVLGDSGYPCTHYLLTPVLNPTTPAELRYNSAHIRTRTTIERCFGIWKATFRALQNGMLLQLDTVKAAIVAMAILHNIRIEKQQYGDECEDYKQLRANMDKSLPEGNILTSVSQYPHMALLENEDSSWSCIGALISEQFILTAAFCVYNKFIEEGIAHLGFLDKGNRNKSGTLQERKIIQTYKHPYADIALLELATPVEYTKGVVPVCLHADFNIPTDSAQEIGWNFRGKILDSLQVINFTLSIDAECASIFRGLDVESQLCAAIKEEEFVEKDGWYSISPLLILDKLGTPKIVGILLHRAHPARYTRVSHYIRWIESIVWPEASGHSTG